MTHVPAWSWRATAASANITALTSHFHIFLLRSEWAALCSCFHPERKDLIQPHTDKAGFLSLFSSRSKYLRHSRVQSDQTGGNPTERRKRRKRRRSSKRSDVSLVIDPASSIVTTHYTYCLFLSVCVSHLHRPGSKMTDCLWTHTHTYTSIVPTGDHDTSLTKRGRLFLTIKKQQKEQIIYL